MDTPADELPELDDDDEPDDDELDDPLEPDEAELPPLDDDPLEPAVVAEPDEPAFFLAVDFELDLALAPEPPP